MALGEVLQATNAADRRRVVLSTFGTMLGLIPEHRSPNAEIQWNEPLVYAFYNETRGWSKETVQQQILYKFSSEFGYRSFDRDSIMMYHFPKELTRNGIEIGINDQLSRSDKQFVGRLYPFPDPPRELTVNGPALTFELERLALNRFRFEAKVPGQVVTAITVEGAPPGTEVILYGPNNDVDQLADNLGDPDRSNSRVERKLAPGVYHVKVRHLKLPTPTKVSIRVTRCPSRASGRRARGPRRNHPRRPASAGTSAG